MSERLERLKNTDRDLANHPTVATVRIVSPEDFKWLIQMAELAADAKQALGWFAEGKPSNITWFAEQYTDAETRARAWLDRYSELMK